MLVFLHPSVLSGPFSTLFSKGLLSHELPHPGSPLCAARGRNRLGFPGWNIERLIPSPRVPLTSAGKWLGPVAAFRQPELTHVMPTPMLDIRKHVLRILRDSSFLVSTDRKQRLKEMKSLAQS